MRRGLITVLMLVGTGGCSPRAPQPNLSYVSLERGDAVIAVDTDTAKVAARYEVGKRPRGIALSPDGRTLYVAVSGSPIGGPGVDEDKLPPPDRRADGIAVIDLASSKRVRVLAAGSDPETFALSPNGDRLFVSNEDQGTVSSVPVNGGAIRTVKVGDEPEGVAITPDGRTLFVACEGSDSVAMIDIESMRVEKTIAIAGRPRSLLMSRDGHTLFVAVENAGKLTLVDATTGQLKTVIDLARGDAMVRPMGLAEAADGRLYVATGRGQSVIEVDPSAGRILRIIAKVGARPWGIAITGNGGLLLSANGPSDDVGIVDLRTGTLKTRIPTGGSPWGIAAAVATP